MTKTTKKLAEILEAILYWKNKAETTPDMLLSSHHLKSDECVEIMNNYFESFKTAEKALAEYKKELNKKPCSCYDGSGIICKEHFYSKVGKQ